MPDPIAVNSMFCRIARRYDLANRLLSGGVDLWWRRELVTAVKQIAPRQILDLATGSGDVAFALARRLKGTQIVGADFCQPMLDEAAARKSAHGGTRYGNITFQQGDGLALPFANDSFDAVTISFGLRNMADRHLCLSEMYRVLKPKGRLFVLEFSQPQAWFRTVYFFYLRKILPAFAGLVTGDRAAYVYLNDTIGQFPSAPALSAEFGRAGFKDVKARQMSFGIVALHEGSK